MTYSGKDTLPVFVSVPADKISPLLRLRIKIKWTDILLVMANACGSWDLSKWDDTFQI